LNRLIQTKILNPIASKIIGEDVKAGSKVSVDEKNGELVIEVAERKKSIVAKEKIKV
jgi:ATP-dependent Clp protease ATP-binding subunit ClpA